MSKYRIAVIAGDGIGNEVIPEGIRVLESVGGRFGLSFVWDYFDWSCEYYSKHGRMMPEDGLSQIGKHDAIYLGAVGFPGEHPLLRSAKPHEKAQQSQPISRPLCTHRASQQVDFLLRAARFSRP